MKLSVENLSFSYPGAESTTFHDVNLTIEKGSMVSILGPNGAGKSTLLNCIAGLFEPQHGSVLLDGKPMDEMSVREAARIIGYVPQSHTPVYDYTVKEFVVMGRTPHIGAFATPSATDYEIVEHALEMVGVLKLINKPYTQISGGERQLVTIARAITQEPEFILLDEPTSHLDFGNQMKAVRLIQKLTEQGFGILMTTHNPDQVFYSGGKAALLDRSGELTFGESNTVLTRERLSDLYSETVHVFYSDQMKRRVCLCGEAD